VGKRRKGLRKEKGKKELFIERGEALPYVGGEARGGPVHERRGGEVLPFCHLRGEAGISSISSREEGKKRVDVSKIVETWWGRRRRIPVSRSVVGGRDIHRGEDAGAQLAQRGKGGGGL